MADAFDDPDPPPGGSAPEGGQDNNLRVDGIDTSGPITLTGEPLIPSVRADRDSLTLGFDVDGAPPGTLLIGHLRSGRLSYTFCGSERRYHSGDVFSALQPEHLQSPSSAQSDAAMAVIDAPLLSQFADTAPGRRQQPVRLTSDQPYSPKGTELWKSTYAYVRDMLQAVPGSSAGPLLTTTAAGLLVATVLSVFPTNALTDPTIEDRHDAHPAALRRAVMFIDEHAHQPVTLTDIAAAAFVTPRAVQLAFRTHLDTTPLEYLRRVRLDHAHRDLTGADPGRETVTAVAYRWGLPSPSRFSSYYRQAYGITPRQTLHRRLGVRSASRGTGETGERCP